jgi:hypothetical protein
MKPQTLNASKSLAYLTAFGGESGDSIIMSGVIDLDGVETFEHAAASCGAVVTDSEFCAGFVVVDNSCDLLKDVVRPVSEAAARSYAEALCAEAGDDAVDFRRRNGVPLYEHVAVKINRGMFDMARRQHMASCGRYERACLESVLAPCPVDDATREALLQWCLDPHRAKCPMMEDAIEYSVWHGVCAVGRSDVEEWRAVVRKTSIANSL